MKIELRRKRQHQLQLKIRKDERRHSTYQTIHYEYPQLVHIFLQDLMTMDGFTENEIGFAAGVRLDIIRRILNGDRRKGSKTVFFNLLGLYARVFCDWLDYPNPE